MNITRRSTIIIFHLSGVIFFGLGCGSSAVTPKKADIAANQDQWTVEGRVATHGFAHGEVLALAMDGSRYRSAIASDDRFGLSLPGNATYAVYFLAADHKNDLKIGEKSELTAMGALLKFEDSPEIGLRDTLRLPNILFRSHLDLGEIDIKGEQAFPTVNPALTLDFDFDGLSDFADLDDQNDGLADRAQRQASERVEICHYGSDDHAKTHDIPLTNLFSHIMHGDTVGPCQLLNDLEPNLLDTKSVPNATVASEATVIGRVGSGNIAIEKTTDQDESDGTITNDNDGDNGLSDDEK